MNREDYDPNRPNGAAVAAGILVLGIVWGLGGLFVIAVGAVLIRVISWVVGS